MWVRFENECPNETEFGIVCTWVCQYVCDYKPAWMRIYETYLLHVPQCLPPGVTAHFLSRDSLGPVRSVVTGAMRVLRCKEQWRRTNVSGGRNGALLDQREPLQVPDAIFSHSHLKLEEDNITTQGAVTINLFYSSSSELRQDFGLTHVWYTISLVRGSKLRSVGRACMTVKVCPRERCRYTATLHQ